MAFTRTFEQPLDTTAAATFGLDIGGTTGWRGERGPQYWLVDVQVKALENASLQSTTENNVVSSGGSAFAALTPGSGAGYFGGAWYDSNQGSVVGPYPTYYACNQALQAAINNATNNFGWTVTSVSPCHYNPPFAPVQKHEYYELAVVSDGPGDSGNVAGALLDEASKLRETYRIDAYDKALKAFIEIVDPNGEEEASDKPVTR